MLKFIHFSGLSIQPVSESASQLESLVKDVEQVYRVLQDACNEVTASFCPDNRFVS